MQSPKGFAHFLIDEASENGGKISVAVAIINKFAFLADISIFDHLVKKIDVGKNPAKTIANATKLLKSFVEKWIDQDQVRIQNLLFSNLETT
jgi:hypothetical protein